jgi:hypothetical protein
VDEPQPTSTLRWIALAALAGLAIGAQIWSVMVCFSGTPVDADYFLRPIEGLVQQWRLVTVVAGVLNLGALLMVQRLRRRGAVTEVGIVLPVVLAGGFLGAVYATLTEPVVGANIGAGLALMATPFVLGALGVWFVVSLRRRRTI